MSMAEEEQSYRHRVVESAVAATIASDRRGQWMGFGIAVAGLAVAAVLGAFASPTAGVVFGSVNLAAIVGLFLRRERAERASAP